MTETKQDPASRTESKSPQELSVSSKTGLGQESKKPSNSTTIAGVFDKLENLDIDKIKEFQPKDDRNFSEIVAKNLAHKSVEKAKSDDSMDVNVPYPGLTAEPEKVDAVDKDSKADHPEDQETSSAPIKETAGTPRVVKEFKPRVKLSQKNSTVAGTGASAENEPNWRGPSKDASATNSFFNSSPAAARREANNYQARNKTTSNLRQRNPAGHTSSEFMEIPEKAVFLSGFDSTRHNWKEYRDQCYREIHEKYNVYIRKFDLPLYGKNAYLHLRSAEEANKLLDLKNHWDEVGQKMISKINIAGTNIKVYKYEKTQKRIDEEIKIKMGALVKSRKGGFCHPSDPDAVRPGECTPPRFAPEYEEKRSESSGARNFGPPRYLPRNDFSSGPRHRPVNKRNHDKHQYLPKSPLFPGFPGLNLPLYPMSFLPAAVNPLAPMAMNSKSKLDANALSFASAAVDSGKTSALPDATLADSEVPASAAVPETDSATTGLLNNPDLPSLASAYSNLGASYGFLQNLQNPLLNQNLAAQMNLANPALQGLQMQQNQMIAGHKIAESVLTSNWPYEASSWPLEMQNQLIMLFYQVYYTNGPLAAVEAIQAPFRGVSTMAEINKIGNNEV